MAPIEDLLRLPLHGHGEAAPEESSCDATKIYVSLEEKSILNDIRALRNRAIELRTQQKSATSEVKRAEFDAELDDLRSQRKELEKHREAAYTRKMVMLGHIPPEVDLL
ncbi:MAG: hypothetical protein GY906_21505 [bacterium]|nr:hypothetical protein [bacterium]